MWVNARSVHFSRILLLRRENAYALYHLARVISLEERILNGSYLESTDHIVENILIVEVLSNMP
jgi:hypothetical protein